MRIPIVAFLVMMGTRPCFGQGSPPVEPESAPQQKMCVEGTPPTMPPPGRMQHMTDLAKKQIDRAITGRTLPPVQEWQPLSAHEKFQVFLKYTYSPRTFANAAIDTLADEARHGRNVEYERSWMGLGQHYGVHLATSETDVFFERFLVPTLLKQDPRYFRNPGLPFMKRALYSVSRVLITHNDKGGETINASRILGGTASQALADLYVPGMNQGMRPIANRVAFDAARDASMNLVHEFWPDIRRKVVHQWLHFSLRPEN